MTDRLSTSGEVTIRLDFRTTDTTARYVPAEELSTLLAAVAAVTGPGTKVFFDFGRLSITGANLEQIRERFAGPSS